MSDPKSHAQSWYVINPPVFITSLALTLTLVIVAIFIPDSLQVWMAHL